MSWVKGQKRPIFFYTPTEPPCLKAPPLTVTLNVLSPVAPGKTLNISMSRPTTGFLNPSSSLKINIYI